MQLCGSLSILWPCLSLGLEWKLTFSSPVASAEFSKFACILRSIWLGLNVCLETGGSCTTWPSPLNYSVHATTFFLILYNYQKKKKRNCQGHPFAFFLLNSLFSFLGWFWSIFATLSVQQRERENWITKSNTLHSVLLGLVFCKKCITAIHLMGEAFVNQGPKCLI